MTRLPPTAADRAKDGPGKIYIQDIGRERYARLLWRNVEVSERVPLHFWKMNESAKEVEVTRVIASLIKKLKRVFGAVPDSIVGVEELQ
jgi:hypothetical protein